MQPTFPDEHYNGVFSFFISCLVLEVLRFFETCKLDVSDVIYSRIINYVYKMVDILGLHSISRDAPDNVSHPRRLDPTMELITYSIVLYLQHGGHDVKCKPSISVNSWQSSFKPRMTMAIW